jgi:hypothetical protein
MSNRDAHHAGHTKLCAGEAVYEILLGRATLTAREYVEPFLIRTDKSFIEKSKQFWEDVRGALNSSYPRANNRTRPGTVL